MSYHGAVALEYVLPDNRDLFPFITDINRSFSFISREQLFSRGGNCFESNDFKRNRDTFLPEYLVFETTGIDLNQFKNVIKNARFSLCGNALDLVSGSLSFYTELEGIEQINNGFVVKLPLYFMTNPIMIVCAPYCSFKLRIDNINDVNNFIQNVFCMVKNTILGHQFRQQIQRNPQVQFVQLSCSHSSYPIQFSHSVDLRLSGLTTGYFIETNAPILSIQMFINQYSILNFGIFEINTYCKRITNNLIYVPLTNDSNFRSRDFGRYSSGVNQDRVDHIRMTIEFNQNEPLPEKVGVHCFSYNQFRYSDGCIGIGMVPFNSDIDDRNVRHQPNNENARPVYPENDIESEYENEEDIPVFEEEEVKQREYDHKFYSWPRHNKPLNVAKNTQCPISLEVIKENDEYCTCAICSYNFDFTILKNYFTTKREMNCPMCRAEWTGKFIYTNIKVDDALESEEEET